MTSKQFVNISNKYDRVVVLVDMDCFYCQVEEKLNPEIRGKPIAVVQYNPWQGGGIIAVNYPARAKGVTRHMRGDEAKSLCPEIELPQVPQLRGKADTSKYRDAGKEVAAVLQTFTPLLERASVDEAYMDITERVLDRLRDMNDGKFHLAPDKLANTYAVGYDHIGEFIHTISGNFNDQTHAQGSRDEADHVAFKKSDIKLLIGASIVNEIRTAVKDKTGYECSAGIAHNKILAKLTAGFHKPNKQTILPLKSIQKMYESLSIKKVKGLGGKLGDQVCDQLKIQFMSELAKFSEKTLQDHFDERLGSWMYLMARGIDLEAVTPKFNSKSIGCCKRFPGKNAINGLASLNHWLGELASEIQERLQKDTFENNRTARQMTVSYTQQIRETDVASTRSIPLVSYEADKIALDALEAIKRNTETFLKPNSNSLLNNPIKFLGISAGKFEDNAQEKQTGIKEMFSNIALKVAQNEPPKSKGIKIEDQPEEMQTNVALKANHHESAVNDGRPAEDKRMGIKEMFSNIALKATQNEPNQKVSSNEKLSEKRENSFEKKNFEKKSIKGFFKIKSETDNYSPVVHNSLDQPSNISSKEAGTEKITNEVWKLNAELLQNDNSMENMTEDLSNENYLNTTLPLSDVDQPSTSHDVSSTFKAVLNNHNDENRIANLPTGIQTDNVNSREAVDMEETSIESTNNKEQVVETKVSSTKEVDGSSDYHQTYAEFYQPPLKLECTVPCRKCGKNIAEQEVQSHLDFHLALELSHQQREEFRKEIKSKFASPLPKQKPVNSKSKSPKINKFLTPITSEPERSEQYQKCDECSKMIISALIQEHLDYHTARKLQLELNQSEMSLISTNDKSNSLKRKRSSTNNKQPKQTPKVNHLTSYFNKM